MSDEYFNPEITEKIKAKTEIQIKRIDKEQKATIESISSETENKIKKLRERIIEEASEKAESEFQKEKAKQKLEIRLKKTKFQDKLVEDLIEESLKEIEALTYELNTARLEGFLKVALEEKQTKEKIA